MFPIEIKIKDISLNPKTILIKDSEILIEKNDFIYIEGKNHTGKSTLLNIINANELNGINVDVEIISENKKLSQESLDTYKRKISYVRQEDDYIFDNVKQELYFEYTKYGKEINHDRIDELLDEFNLSHIKNKKKTLTSKLSGGERKKISIIKGLLNEEAELFILDEPFNNLDLHSVVMVINLLYKMNKNSNVTIIATSHFPLFLGVNKKLIIQEGKIHNKYILKDNETKIVWKINEDGIHMDWFYSFA